MQNAPRRSACFHLGLSIIVGLALYGALAPGAWAVNLNEAVGFTPNHTLSSDSTGEHIDHQTGIVNLSIPLGPVYRVGPRVSYQLRLSYASHIWRVRSEGGPAVRLLRRDGAFGVGWDMHLGRIEQFQDNYGWQHEYVSPDGSHHPLGASQQLGGVLLSLDGTYIRATPEGPQPPEGVPTGWWLEFSDGTKAHFEGNPSTSGSFINAATSERYYRMNELFGLETDSMEQPYAKVTVAYGTGQTERCMTSITDTLGRAITFGNTPTSQGGRTDSIQQPGVNVATPTPAPWFFDYGTRTLESPDATNPPTTVSGRFLLETLKYPGPTLKEPLLEFDYDTFGMLERRYWMRQADEELNPALHPYVLYTYVPDTFRVLAYVGEVWELGIHTTRVLGGKTLVDGTGASWSWTRTEDADGYTTYSVLEDPDGNLTEYRYEGSYGIPDADRWKIGLPLSVTHYAGVDPNPRRLLMEESWVYQPGYYEDGNGDVPDIVQNIEIQSHTVASEAADGYFSVTTRSLGIDAFGRPAQVVVEAVGRGLYRRTRTEWLPPSGSDWVLGRWSSRTVYDEYGRPFAHESATFSPSGLLEELRVHADPSGVTGPFDVVTDPEYDAKGLLRRTTTQRDDGSEPYEVEYGYQNTADAGTTHVARTRATHPGGDSGPELTAPWYASNRDIDKHTGLVVRSLHPDDEFPSQAAYGDTTPNAGHDNPSGGNFPKATTFAWDLLGRPTLVSAPGESPTQISYPSLWRTEVKQCKATDATDCRESIYIYDRRGQLVEEQRRAVDGSYDVRRTEYDWAGRVTRSSEWFPPAGDIHWTTFSYVRTTPDLGKDPFGRPWSVTAADDAITTFTHNSEVRTATVHIGALESKTQWIYDAFGRLVAVDAPLGADARYEYDLAGKLLRAELFDPAAPTVVQTRAFNYDTLGRLVSSTTPEGGTVQVLEYDSLGRVLRTQDARGREFKTVYDDAGRVLEFYEIRGASSLRLAVNTYDSNGVSACWPSTPARGRQVRADSFDEWVTSGTATTPVAEVCFDYLDSAGRLSAQRTRYAAWSGKMEYLGDDNRITVEYGYDDWGELARLKYPLVAPATGRTLEQVADVAYNRKHGWLLSVEDLSRGWTTDPANPKPLLSVQSYNATGAPGKWLTGNHVTTEVFSDVRFRPKQIQVTGFGGALGGLWDSGVYDYYDDGSINHMGSDDFDYDALGRLTKATVRFDQEEWVEDYKYDGFGNMTKKTTDPPSGETVNMPYVIDALTNRITHSGQEATFPLEWDPAGNLILDRTQLGGNLEAPLVFDGRGRLGGIGERVLMSDPPATAKWKDQFAYDSGGLRVVRMDEEAELMTFYVRDASDQVLSEFIKPVDSIEPPVWNRDTYYALGQVLAVSDATKIGPPVSLTAAVTATESGYLVTLTWEAPADWSGTIPNYQILRKLTWNGTSVVVGTDCEVGTDCPPNRSWSETVTAGGYWYQVRALADPGTGTAVPGALSRILKVDPGPTGPHAVASVTAEAREGSIRVLWPRSQDDLFNSTAGPLYDFQDYTVSRRVELTPGTWDLWEVLTDRTVREPYYLDPAPPTGVNLEYKVTVADTSGNSTSTTVPTSVQVATDPYRSPAPGGLFSSPGPAALEVAIGWEGVPGNGVMSYKVYKLTGTNPPEWTAQSVFYATSTGWAQNAVDPRFIPSTSTRAKLTGLAEKTPVTLAVAALDAVGESLLSTPLIVRPALDGDDPWPLEPPDGFGGIRSGRRTASFQVDASQPSHIYRRVEGAPGLYDLRNGTPAIAVGDQDLNPCKAYVYLANRAEMTVQDGVSVPTGEVSADTIPVWVKRYAAAQAPVMGMATGCEGNALKWMESFEDQCAPGVDFNTVSWKLRRVGGYDSPVTVAANLAPGATACDALADPTEAYYYWAEVKIENLKDLGIAPQYDDMPWGTVACVKNGVINPAFCNWPPVNLNGGDAPPPPPPPRPRKQKISDPTVELWLPEEYRGEETVITDASASAIMAEECSGEPTEGPASDRPAAGTTCGDPAFSKVSEDIGTAESMPVMSDATTSVDGDSWTHAEAGSTIVGDAIGVLARGPSDGFDVGLECTLNDDAIFLGTALQLASICTVGAGVGASEDSDNWEGDSTAQSLSTHTIDLSALLESDLIVVGDPPPPQVWSPAERGYRLTFLHSDHLGTTRVGTKEDGTVAFRSASLPFGERLIGQLPGTTIDDLESHSKSFAGHARDDRTDALYMRARYNSPILCRFVDPDPELAAVDRSGAWNRYPYVESSPMNRVDPTGGRWLPGTAPPRTGPGPWSIPCYACFQRGEGWTDEDWQKFSEGAAKAKESLTSETKAHFREKYKVDLDEYYTDGSGPVVDATAKIDGASGEITRGWFGDRITLDLSDLFNRDGSVNQARLEHTTLHESEHYANTPWFGREPSVKTPADVATKALEAVGKQKFFKHNNYSVIGFWAEVIQFGFIF